MESESKRLGALTPSNFGSWIQTRADFAAAIKAGPGMVALVGPEGSGKTYTLTAFALALEKQGVRLRGVGQPLEAGVSVDLVDNVDAEGSRRLDAGRPFPGLRAVAIRPELLEPLLLTHPGMRVVRVGRMSSADIRTMLETRRGQLGLLSDALTSKAFSSFDRLCGGNPRKLDRLFGRAERAARLAHSRKILGEHVAQAERELTNEQPGELKSIADRQPSPVIPVALTEAPEAGKTKPDDAVQPGVESNPYVPRPPVVSVFVGTAEPVEGSRDNHYVPVEPVSGQEPGNAHAAMWARLATPSTPAERAAAKAMSAEPERSTSILAWVSGVVAVVLVLLPPSYHGQLWRLVSGAATAVRHYGATIAETRPWPTVASSEIRPARAAPTEVVPRGAVIAPTEAPPAVRVPESAGDELLGNTDARARLSSQGAR